MTAVSRVCATLIAAIFSFSLVLSSVPAQALSNENESSACPTDPDGYPVVLASVYPGTYTLEQLLGEGCEVEDYKQADTQFVKIFQKDGVLKMRIGLQDDTFTWHYKTNDEWVEVDQPVYAIKHKVADKNSPRRLVVTNRFNDPMVMKVWAGTIRKPVKVVTFEAGQTKTIKLARYKKNKYPAFYCRTYVKFMGMQLPVGSFDTSGPIY